MPWLSRYIQSLSFLLMRKGWTWSKQNVPGEMSEQKFRAEVMHKYILKGKYSNLKPVTLRKADSDHTHTKEP